MDLDANAKPKSRRGFAAMNPERRREIARKGGASVPGEKRSFAKDRDLAAVDLGKTRHHRRIIRVTPVAVDLNKILKYLRQQVERIRPVGMPCGLDTLKCRCGHNLDR